MLLKTESVRVLSLTYLNKREMGESTFLQHIHSLCHCAINGDPLAVAQLSSSANLSRNYPLLFQIFHHSSHLLSLCNFLIQNYQSSISVVLHLRPLIPNHCLFSSMTSVLFSPLLQPLPMNLSSLVTLTSISIILQTLSPLSFCLSSLLSISVNMFTSLRTTKITFSI